MCGVAGIFDLRGAPNQSELSSNVTTMIRTLSHRGPDGEDIWCDQSAGIGLGHRRLAIIDLSDAGKQPMVSANQRFVISYNGEVYNAPDLATELRARGCTFRGHSDTETILECCSQWGVERCVQRLNGMFAFALWDRKLRSLTFVRDRSGIKPLYWARFSSVFLFGSEIKAIRAHPCFSNELDHGSIASFMRYGYVPAPASIYRNVYKLEPGHVLTIDMAGTVTSRSYWDIGRLVAVPAAPSRRSTVDELETVLSDAVRRCMLSDVPIGAFLSGGIDSSVVTALMQANSSSAVRTFTIGFEDAGFDEAVHAKSVAAHLGTDHNELYVTNHDLLNTIPKLSYHFDEPFADPSQIPTFLLAGLTRQQVSVALSGDGGDELFGGYSRYFQTQRLWNGFAWIPRRLLPQMAVLLDEVSGFARRSRATSLLGLDIPPIEDKWHKLADFLRGGDSLALYRQLQSSWPRPEDLVLNSKEPRNQHWHGAIPKLVPALLDQLRMLDFLTYLPDHVLTKVDRATMSVGLEARVPLLDHRVIEFAWSVPGTMHTKNGEGKSLLRDVLARYVPRKLFERPKWGFMPPLANWLRGPLKEWANDLLDDRALRDQSILNSGLVRRRWKDHLGRTDRKDEWCSPLWNVLTFQAWLANEKSAAATAIAHPHIALAPTVAPCSYP